MTTGLRGQGLSGRSCGFGSEEARARSPTRRRNVETAAGNGGRLKKPKRQRGNVTDYSREETCSTWMSSRGSERQAFNTRNVGLDQRGHRRWYAELSPTGASGALPTHWRMELSPTGAPGDNRAGSPSNGGIRRIHCLYTSGLPSTSQNGGI